MLCAKHSHILAYNPWHAHGFAGKKPQSYRNKQRKLLCESTSTKIEITNHVEVIPPNEFNLVGIRFFLHLPVTVDGKQVQGPFMHRPGDNDSSAVTFWQTWPDELRKLLQTALDALDQYENSN
jgi:hypothetical protein